MNRFLQSAPLSELHREIETDKAIRWAKILMDAGEVEKAEELLRSVMHVEVWERAA